MQRYVLLLFILNTSVYRIQGILIVWQTHLQHFHIFVTFVGLVAVALSETRILTSATPKSNSIYVPVAVQLEGNTKYEIRYTANSWLLENNNGVQLPLPTCTYINIFPNAICMLHSFKLDFNSLRFVHFLSSLKWAGSAIYT